MNGDSDNRPGIGQRGLDLIKSFESLRLEAYLCPAQVLTIGYGHISEDVGPGQIITEERAEYLLRRDVDVFEAAVREVVKVPLKPDQFNALVSLAFNIGAEAFKNSTLVRLLNQKDYLNAADQFLRWNRANGRILAGLTKRRKAERWLFLALDTEGVKHDS